MSYKIESVLNQVETPCYICEEELLENNLKLLNEIQTKTDIKILLALKGFAFSPLLFMVKKYLKGCCCSGLYEAKYAKEFINKEIHTFSPAFKDNEFDEISNLSNHIIFNSFSQLNRLQDRVSNNKSIGIRVNPEVSIVEVELYNPSAPFSRLGVTEKEFQQALNENKNILERVEGLHFHTLCEQNTDALLLVLNSFETKFGKYFKNLKWVNFGGGHHITRDDYNIKELIDIIEKFKIKYQNLDIYLELGEAVGWETGTLVASVIDIIHNEKDIAILDISAEAHMPDTLAMPYSSEILGGEIGDKLKYKYRLWGNSCLTGDIMRPLHSNTFNKNRRQNKVKLDIFLVN